MISTFGNPEAVATVSVSIQVFDLELGKPTKNVQ